MKPLLFKTKDIYGATIAYKLTKINYVPGWMNQQRLRVGI